MFSTSKEKKKVEVPKQVLESFKKLSSPQNSLSSPLGGQNSNQITECFNFRVQLAASESDPTLCWAYNIPQLKSNQKILTLLTQSFQTVLVNFVGDDFPQTVSFGLRNFNGFINKAGNQTNKFIVMDLVGTTIKTGINGLTSRDLVYKSQMYNVWDLGTQRSLQMEMYVDQDPNPVHFPLTTPVQVCFKIIHTVM